jgi:hypothetical protein
MVGGASQGLSSQGHWDTLIAALDSWAREVAYEIETPDFWAELRQMPQILAAVVRRQQRAIHR